ncbi:hypothetical protein BsWGS_09409 [Bradybaena similaris]
MSFLVSNDRCIKPNDKQVPGGFSRDRVKTQLQYNGVKEVARIRTFGFPIRLSKVEFRKTYGCLADINSKSDLFLDILQIANADPTDYKVGRNQIFMKEPVKNALDSALEKFEAERAIERLEQELAFEEKRKQKSEEMKRIKEKKETQKKAQLLGNELDDEIVRLSTVSLETIAEASTPASHNDDYVYNGATGSTVSEIQTTADSEDDESEEETSAKTVFEEPKEEVPVWDITQELTEEEERYDVHEQPILMVIKSIVYILLFVVCLGSFVFQKIGLLFLTTNLKNTQQQITKTGVDVQPVIYLFLVIALCIPYALSWLFSLAKICFGNFKKPSVPTWIWVFLMENFHTGGLCLLVFRVLPSLDIIRSVMLLSATAILPSVLKCVMSSSDFQATDGLCIQCNSQAPITKILRYILDLFVMLFQISVIPLLLIESIGYFNDQAEQGDYKFNLDSYQTLEIIITFVLVSCGHWENFTDGRLFCELGPKNYFKNAILKIRFELQNGRHYPHLLTYVWKIGLTILLGYYLNMDDGFSYDKAFDAFTVRKKPIQARAVAAGIALMVSAFVAFFASFGACVFQMQIFSLTIPALLAMPVTIAMLYLNCHFQFLGFLNDFVGPEHHEKICLGMHNSLDIEKYWYHFLLGFAWWLSLLVLTRHMWRPKLDRAANIARLFVNPSYCSILTCEYIMLNRIRNPSKVRELPVMSEEGDIKVIYYKLGGKLNEDEPDEVEDVEIPPIEPASDKHANDENPATPMLYACATMWHETRTEMVQLLKSLHRLDRDQYIRRLVNEVKGFDPEFYNFEAHIFFDDAMEPDDNDEQVPNNYVKELVACMDVACSSVHGKPMKVHPPTKVPTPYGGQLIWQMPGENLLFVHMKDIKKIRNRKRWSQVMYMHYLLEYRHIMMSKHEVLEKMQDMNARRGHHGLNLNEINYLLGEELAVKAQNTFLLALDGDTDFSPGAIKILLDRMKDEKVGASCGRIHPIGNGPMVWYQKFEYAIGHWLQKAAEHVFGCVLCSPGCFSMFRASALLDTNVMKRYTTEPTEPSHHLQYDQGEDRWLCTLLLQQGYRIEYAAAADAWTFAPEGFFEFFNQRRRWMPSTIANILDLLNSASLTTKRNANMSTLYIGYQWLLMLMTILGPGTIIMMIAGAVKLVFKFTLIESYVFATVPAVVFTISCFWFSSKVQLILAAILSILYSFIMMIVLVGTIITATTEDVLHPSVIVIVMLIGIFLIAGLCHPQEIYCLVHGALYLLTIPSGYLLLVIYSICNLNDVSWGTREVPTKAERLEMERKKKEKEEQEKNKPKKSFFAKIFNSGEEHIRELTKLLKTIMPNKPSAQEQLGIALSNGSEANQQESKTVIELLMRIDESLKQLVKKKGNGEDDSEIPSIVVDQPPRIQSKPSASAKAQAISGTSTRPKEAHSQTVPAVPDPQGGKKKKKKQRDELKNPLWAEDKGLGNGVTIEGNKQELTFWREFVDRYLLPIRPSVEEKKKISDGLRDLRNSSTFAMMIVNLLWMSLNFMFQQTNAARFTIRYGVHNERKIEESVLGMGFVLLLLILLLLQMVGMVIHRIGTLQHLLAITQIRVCKAQEGSTSDEKKDREDAIRHIKEVLKIPMTGDVGVMTQAPTLINPNENHWGITVVRHSARGTLGQDHSNSTLIRNLGRTITNPTFAGGRSAKLYDPRTQETFNGVTQRLVAGSAIQKLRDVDEFGKSFRPRLPPRGRSFHQPMMVQATNFGFTQRELDKANINVPADLNQNSEFTQMGAMGRSLFVRSKVINETSDVYRRNSSYWNDSDKPVSKKFSLTREFTEFNHL